MAVVVNDLGLALATIANVPVVVLITAVAVLSWRVKVFPIWVGWLSVVAAVLPFVVYPVFVVWLLTIITIMVISTGRRDVAV